MSRFGIDVSSYQGTIDWKKVVATDIKFAILKVIRKDLNPDKQFENNWAGCEAAGMPIHGVYNYSYANTVEKAVSDAKRVLEILNGRKVRVYLDVEDDCLKGLGRKLFDIIDAYAGVVIGSGLEFGVYTGSSFYNSYIKPYGTLQCPVWIANYGKNDGEMNTKPQISGINMVGWQFTSMALVDGVAGRVDKDVWYEELEQKKDKGQGETQMSKTGQALAVYANGKLGMPYFYGSKIQYGKLTENYMKKMHISYPKTVTTSYMKKARNRGQVGVVNSDCSGLISGYTEKIIGSYQMYQQAYTRLPIANIKDFAIGTVLWKSGHVGIYIGMENGIPMCIEAKGIDYGVVKTKVSASKWVYGLTFKELTYSYEKNLSDTASWKGTNPYAEPTRTIKRYCKGEDVKWVQWELREAGFDRRFVYNGKTYAAVEIDGDAGKITDAAIRAFQASCKITVDGKCGKTTRKYLKAN